MAGWVDEVREAADRAQPQIEGEIRIPGLRHPVEVIRDRWGVPHIYAATLDDLFVAQGFVVGSERLFQIDSALRLANGRLATMFGELVVSTDRFARTVGWNRAGARIAAHHDEPSRQITSAYRAGVRAWVEAMPAKPVEYVVLDLDPDLPDDEGYWTSGAVLMAWGLSGNWDNELLRAEIADRLGWDAMLDLFPDLPTEAPSVVAGTRPHPPALDLLRNSPRRPPAHGSNNWVVAGSRTTTGKPLLANDPHLATQMPSIWFEVHLSAPGYEASGVALPFSPGVLIGRTAHHAWGFTNVGGDTQDLYVERLSEDGRAARYGGEWEPLTVHREEILVRGRDEPEVLEVRETRHGPLLDSYLVGRTNPEVIEGGIRETYALRWTGHEHAIMPSAVLGMAEAGNFEEFREAVRFWECPGQNVVYGDVEGTIGYQCTGLYPVRGTGDGTLPVPGWTAEYEWEGFVEFEELPWNVDPEEGFLATANNKVHGDGYPHLIGRDFLPPFRARRIVELLTSMERHTPATFSAIQLDTVSIPARENARRLVHVEPATDRQKEAIAHLQDWDGDLAPGSVAACIYQVWLKHIARQVLLPRLGRELYTHYYARRDGSNGFQFQALPNLLANPTARWLGANGRGALHDVLRRALDDAIDELEGPLGRDMDAWRWGAVHRVVLAGPLALIPDLAELFTGGVVEAGGDEQTICQGAFEPDHSYDVAVLSSWRQIIDLSDADAAVGIHPTGQSGHPASEHWNDLLPLWARGEHHPLAFTRRAVEAHAEAALTLVPAVT
ncbi:MAG TPA: penicillin acylase family protein [Actinomycetota bacterium]|nr:penicillin acylase family protein [Actinomycetota bacterium]